MTISTPSSSESSSSQGEALKNCRGTPRHHFDVFTAQPARGPAAIHGRVADADDQNAFADGIDMPEGNGFQPVDADVNPIGVVPSGDVEIFSARRAATHKNRVEALASRACMLSTGEL